MWGTMCPCSHCQDFLSLFPSVCHVLRKTCSICLSLAVSLSFKLSLFPCFCHVSPLVLFLWSSHPIFFDNLFFFSSLCYTCRICLSPCQSLSLPPSLSLSNTPTTTLTLSLSPSLSCHPVPHLLQSHHSGTKINPKKSIWRVNTAQTSMPYPGASSWVLMPISGRE